MGLSVQTFMINPRLTSHRGKTQREKNVICITGKVYMKLIVAALPGRRHRVSGPTEGACAGEGSQPPKLEPCKAMACARNHPTCLSIPEKGSED